MTIEGSLKDIERFYTNEANIEQQLESLLLADYNPLKLECCIRANLVYFTNLTHLRLTNLRSVDPCAHLLKRFSQITSLNVNVRGSGGCQKESDWDRITMLVEKHSQIKTLHLTKESRYWPLFAKLTQLTFLDLSFSNNIEIADCKPLSNLTNLTGLDWSWTKPKLGNRAGFLDILTQPEKIKILYSSYCGPIACSYEKLNRFSNLTSLELISCPYVNDELLIHLNLPNLECLNVSINRSISNVGACQIGKFKNLTFLSLAFCPLVCNRAIKEISSSLTCLTNLQLNGCSYINEAGLGSIGSLVLLEHLSFGGGSVWNLSFIQHLTKLKTLFIEQAGIDAAQCSVPMISTLTNLTFLDIRNAPNIDDEAVESLSSMTQLISLSIHDADITSRGEEVIKRLNRETIVWIG